MGLGSGNRNHFKEEIIMSKVLYIKGSPQSEEKSKSSHIENVCRRI